MSRWWIVALLVGCEAPVGPPAPAHDRADVPLPSWPLGRVVGRLGREVAPQPVATLTIDGEGAGLREPIVWAIPGDGPARAAVSGRDGVELVEVDRRRVVWRDARTCDGPVVGVTATRIVCAGPGATHALALDGRVAWTAAAPFAAMTADRVITDAGDGGVAVRDATSGAELETVRLPAGVTSDAVVAACDRDVYAATPDGKLARIDGKLLWATPLGGTPVLPDGLDPCDGATVLVVAGGAAGPSLVALARDTGKVVGRVDGLHGVWPERGGTGDRVEVATARGVARMPRDLSTSEVLALPPLGALLALRDERRLVRATPRTAIVLDPRGVRAFVPLAEQDAALGDDAILAGGGLVGGDDATLAGAGSLVGGAWPLRLFAIPHPWARPVRLPPDPVGLALPAELRDLPRVVPLDAARAVALPAVQGAVAASALDPIDPAVYAATRDGEVARFDLAARAWTWQRADACPPGDAILLAASRAVVVCATHAELRGTTRDGRPAWRRAADVDAVAAAADVVVVHGADRIRVLDADDGHLLGTVATAHAVALDIAAMALVVTAEQGRIVARVPRVWMLPAWSIEVRGVVRALAPSGDGVLVALEDGDAYRVDARTAQITALPDIGLDWRASGDLVIGATAGGPVPPSPLPVPPRPRVPEKYKPADLEAAPAIATPWPPPPPMAASWQLALFELGGGVRARADYALVPPVAQAARRGASPLLVVDGTSPPRVLVIDPVRGDALRRIELPPDASVGALFSTIVDGRPVAGTILAAPLRVVLF